MRWIAGLALAFPLGLAACPGPTQDFDVPQPDADTDPPDAAVEAEAGPPQPFTVMTWNVLNLFNDVRDSFEIAEADEAIVSTAEYQAKLDALAQVITQHQPDALVLQEVENQAVIDDLAAKVGAYPHRHVTLGNDPRGIDIAVLSELPFEVGPSHKGEFFSASTDPVQKFVFARDVLEAHFQINGRHVALLGVHLKSGTDAESQKKRLAEAEQTRKIATGVHFGDPAAAVVVLGDFNDVPGSPPITALGGGPPFELVSAAGNLPAADRYSVVFGGDSMLFDDQLGDAVATALLDVASVQIDHGVGVVADHDPVIATYLVR